MNSEPPARALLDAARETIAEAGCASLVTLDESGTPTSRSVAAFPPDTDFTRIVIGTHPGSRKTVHVQNDSRVLLSYVDNTNRGYLSVMGIARLNDDVEEKKRNWTDQFSAFFPQGPESDEYQLMVVEPQRLEIRSFGLGVADEPTRWSAVVLERAAANEWRTLS